jgi:hypothetical protein
VWFQWRLLWDLPALFSRSQWRLRTRTLFSPESEIGDGMRVGPRSSLVPPGPGSRHENVQWVRFRPPRHRFLCYIAVRARSTYLQIFIARPPNRCDGFAITRQGSTGPSGGIIWTWVPNLPPRKPIDIDVSFA